MRDRKLASRYAGALLSVFHDPTQAESTDDFLTALSRVMDESAKFRDLMLDPAFPQSKRKTVLKTLVDERGLPGQLSNFLVTLVDNNRIGALPTIARVFHELREEALGIVPAEITTATPLDEGLRDRTKNTIEKMMGRKVRLDCKVEPELIGGAVTKIGSKVYDGSLRSQINELRRRMGQE
jgi:F-type H+-transporting ATPase subunit delta